MIRNTKKAFTLVELIVVITILAVLGTIAFISLQGYSGEARDSKRLSNVNDLIKKVNIELSKGTALSTLVAAWTGNGTALTNVSTLVTINNADATEANQGAVNFATLKEDGENFKDGTSDYRFSYAIGGTGSGSYKFIQMATKAEATNQVKLVGNYYKLNNATDFDSIVLLDPTAATWVSGDFLSDWTTLPATGF